MARAETLEKFTVACEDLKALVAEYGSLTQEESQTLENYCKDMLILTTTHQASPDLSLPKAS